MFKYYSRIPVASINMNDSGLMNVVVEAENEKVLPATLELIAHLEKLLYRSGKPSLRAIQDQTVPVMTVFLMNPFHPFFEVFHDTVHRLIETGATKIPKGINNKLFDEEVPALVLTMDDLGIGFIVCLTPVTLSVLAFVFEVVTKKLKYLADTVRALLTTMSVLRVFFNCQLKS